MRIHHDSLETRNDSLGISNDTPRIRNDLLGISNDSPRVRLLCPTVPRLTVPRPASIICIQTAHLSINLQKYEKSECGMWKLKIRRGQCGFFCRSPSLQTERSNPKGWCLGLLRSVSLRSPWGEAESHGQSMTIFCVLTRLPSMRRMTYTPAVIPLVETFPETSPLRETTTRPIMSTTWI